MAGLLDWAQSPAGIGLLGAVAGTMAGARRGQPWNTAGRGLAAGLTAYQSANDQIRTNQNDELARRFQEMKMREIEATAAKARDQKAWRAGLPAMMDKAQTKAVQFEPDDPFNEGAATFDMAYGGSNHGQPVGGMMATVTQQGDPAALEQYLLHPDSPYADELMKRQLLPKEQEWDTTPRYDQRGRAFVTSKTGDIRYLNGIAERVDPNKPFRYGDAGEIVPNSAYQKYEFDKAREGATRVSQNVNSTQEREEHKAVGKFFGEAYADIQRAGFAAAENIARAERLGQLLEGVHTGKFAPLGLEVSKAAQAIGFNIDPNVGNKEAAEALANQMALELRNPAGGAGMPGALSDKDREFLKQMIPGIGVTPEGRKKILFTMKQIAKRNQEVARMAREYRKRNGELDDGFYDELFTFSSANPLFETSQNEKAKSNQPRSDYQEYLDAFKRAKTDEQRRAITERARSLGVVR